MSQILTEDMVRLTVYWVIGSIPLGLGTWIAFFNVTRHWQMRQVRKSGRVQFISGVPIVGSLLFLIGWRVIPVGFTPWVLLILLTEIPAMITFSSAEAPQDGAAADGPDQSASSSADPAELAEAEVDLESDASA